MLERKKLLGIESGLELSPQRELIFAEVNCGKPHSENVVNTENEGEKIN